jgi:hypothetical protein
MCSTVSIVAEQPRINKSLPGTYRKDEHNGMDEE